MPYLKRVAERAWSSAWARFEPHKKVQGPAIAALALLLTFGFQASSPDATWWYSFVSSVLAIAGIFGLIFLVYLLLAPARLDAEWEAQVKELREEIATMRRKPPLGSLQARSDMLRQKVLEYQASHNGERVLWLNYLIPQEEWADYTGVIEAWATERGVDIIRRENVTGYPNIKFKLPKGAF